MAVTVDLVYIHLPHDPEHVDLAARFVASYHEYPPNYPHNTVIVCNGSGPTHFTAALFASLPNVMFFLWNDEGQDIGAYIAFANKSKADVMMCCGGPCYFRRSGWLQRMIQAWRKHGPGMYGSLATFEVSPHINTSGFCVPPSLLREYPKRVVTKADRYNFEHGPDAQWRIAAKKGMPVLLVTWDGEWHVNQWRLPANIYRRGDQSNCLTYFRHSDSYHLADERTKRFMERLADTWVISGTPKPELACRTPQTPLKQPVAA